MENNIFKKMKVKTGFVANVMNPPENYPTEGLDFQFNNTAKEFDFVHLFINNREEFKNLIDGAKKRCKENGLLWVSYPKSNGKVKYDINRDSLWDLSLSYGLHPVAQVALDENWSAIWLLPHDNNDNDKYLRPVK